MKNIHVLPTGKLSRLHYFTANKAGYYLYPNNELVVPRNPNCINQNIYITSDEEIKEGDWFLDDNNQISHSYRLSHVKFANPKKIILTTDQDLIKNGVQAIDDEFLEWFVKNSSCEKVEIERNYADEGVKGITYYGKYFLIIPQEEPKNICIQTGLPCGMQCLSEEACNSIRLKKETLEEAAERLTYHDTLSWENTLAMESFKLGAKWQQERMYSEEEVKKLIELHSDFIDSKIDYEGINNATTAISNPEWNDEEWFEQFKNK
ncbi:hypothetical protein GHT06_001787 [Daphnia sinensis]|uniref:Uncharacterized protein n=1 Tax=Daphnia sinensis TaxID=1820382 RepID=A0AAD5KDU6_9CRUS|nr:hypothetical protein GHT06_001787 [Daphnia sinensis]